ncbi:hypothetical protein LHYA1_G002536 [Lachnellula hyalina]|uniref:Sulfatase N-terminal domain-containing protein n=1 Tax=Lachnellula hyalina TaxID=1316788 RepID=A0A8H8R9I3_9HELO|nr:uncharacterized protein LHYA1_G002536 [Lachnellula hyalina]TVY30053.1 hypothetical protein LHYA1_G002536 [Lachnellula hyalina]
MDAAGLGKGFHLIAFYLETGSEIKWGSAGKFAHDWEGLKVLLSGMVPAFFISVSIAVIARISTQPLYNGTHSMFCKMAKTFGSRRLMQKIFFKGSMSKEWDGGESLDEEDASDPASSPERQPLEDEAFLSRGPRSNVFSRWLNRAIFLGPLITVLILLIVRPRNPPYAHMSGSIPYTLWDIFSPYSEDLCGAGHREFPPFPLPDLLDAKYWEQPHDKFIGWMPSANSSNLEETGKHSPRPSWMPEEAILGFDRWYDRPVRPDHHRRPHPPPPGPPPPGAPPPHGPHGPHGGPHDRRPKVPKYNPVKDPLRISNLEYDILDPITKALKDRKVKIKHVVIVTLESTRKDIFPMKKDSHLYDIVLKTHDSGNEVARVEAELANLTPNAELLTGEDAGYDRSGLESARAGSWRNLTEGQGGINIQGAFTGSTTSLKSLIGSHCGVQPLAVDFTVESHGHIYQPCLPAILRLLNLNKEGQPLEGRKWGFGKKEDEMNGMLWRMVSAQAVTNRFDHQDELNHHIGFQEVIAKETLLNPAAKFPPSEKQSNYFGFPDSQMRPYFQDVFREAKKNDERVFLSHFTSSTHHPWKTPEEFGEAMELLKKGWWSGEHQLNRYLNTVKYDDWWLGETMNILEDEGVADETLVVMVGDHGMAFEEDAQKRSTFENGHISNMRVPLLFHHPSLPRIQLAINATSMSILPTILDLLTTTSSLSQQDSEIASDLLQQYEGQSLIREFEPERNGRQQWNMGVLNPGGTVLSVSSAAVPYRLIMPVCKSGVYRFTSNDMDPYEDSPLEEYSLDSMQKRVHKEIGGPAAQWVAEAEKVGKWWMLEMRRRWDFNGAALQNDRRPEELEGAGMKGTKTKRPWWNPRRR